LGGRDRAVWTSLDGGRMATNTHIPVRSARRCIVRPAVSKFLFVTAVAIATFSALACSGTLKSGPELAQASSSAGAQAVSGKSYGYPVKPFGREHLVRANLGDPRVQFHGPPTLDTLMRGSGSFSFHQGVDITAADGTAVYPVLDGTVTLVTAEEVRVSSGDGRAFEYWHIRPRVRDGQNVTARQTVLGHVKAPSNHVHLTEYERGRVVNPLVPGRLTPYHDSSPPKVRAIMLRRTDSDRELLPNFVRGRVEIVADAEDSPTEPGRCAWHGPVGPALVTWQIRSLTGRSVVPQRVAVDFRTSVPRNSSFWRVYARGTYQNQTVFGNHYSYLERGSYLFKLAPRFDTRTLRDGVYDLIVKASDIRGNSGSQTLRFTVHNRTGWSS
jgi:Peptidase family M23